MMVLLVVLAAAYAGLCAALFFVQRSLVFPAPRERVTAGTSPIVEVPGGTPILWSAADGDGPVVVHFHGNGEQISSLGWLGQELAKKHVSFAAVEYPGYAGAPGAPSESSIVVAAERALHHLTGPTGIARERIVLSGQSLGTGVAVRLAANGWGARLVLLSPYTSMTAVADQGIYRVFPIRLLMRDRFDSASLAPRIALPVLVLHGNRDEVVPFALAGRWRRGSRTRGWWRSRAPGTTTCGTICPRWPSTSPSSQAAE
jgi:alpha-beta hydrolase superfamily lysophospholipase